ncbi:MAG: hypothetical protein EHM45_06855, partial [Desulfobacteraceae bacterium]
MMKKPVMSALKKILARKGMLLIAVTAVAIIALGLHDPIPQPSGYHGFADQRSLCGVPNFADTLSNLPFL